MTKITSMKSLIAVFFSAFVLIASGCATVGGGNSGETLPASGDVLADVLTERKILAAIQDNPSLEATQIGVSCFNGQVTLRGSVSSAIERELAEKLALRVSGVSSITNLLTFD